MPEIGYGSRQIGQMKVFHQIVAEYAGGPNGDVSIT